MNRWHLAWAGLACTGLALAADPPKPPVPPAKPPLVAEADQGEGVSLTIYNQNFVVVKERRLMDLQKGRSAVRFRDVAATIVPESVQFAPLRQPDLARVVEQNYEFDLVGADKLLQKYIDHNISLVTRDGSEIRGQLLSFDDNQLVLKTTTGIDLVPRLGNIRDVQFSALPGGLLTRPTLVWQLDAREARKELVKVAYQANEMIWRVDYRARVNEAGDHMDLAGWVTVTNGTGTSFKDAQVKLLAGDVHLAKSKEREKDALTPEAVVPVTETKVPQFTEKSFSEYHLYELGRKVTVKDQETKQIELLDVANIPVQRKYALRPGESKVAVVLELKNSEKTNAGLGIPLPKGPMRVFQRDLDRELEFAGTDEIDHTPRDETVNVRLGYAFDLTGERKELAHREAGRVTESDMEIRLRNHKTEAVTIDVIEAINGQSNWNMVKQSQPFVPRDVNTLVFPVELKPNSEAVVTYTIRYTW
jgi:hypothetical protein